MPIVVGIRFRDSGKVYYFDPADIALQPGELVIVETVRGLEIGKVAREPHEVPEDEIVGELKRVTRRPSHQDIRRIQELSARQPEVLTVCAERVAAHNLPMRLIKAEYNFDGSRLTFYFTADQRIDFRALVRDLARTFRTRIELRQVGPRDEARLLGGIGPCGRPLCCATFLPDFARVSIKMAKDQDLPLNPSKISGVCGRLLCCLSYEHEQYLEIKAELPPRGAWVQTPHGPGEVLAVNIIRESVTVDVSGNTVDVTSAELAEATALVSGEARSRVSAGAAAPVTRTERQRRHEQEFGDDGLTSLDPEHSNQSLLDVAEERLPHRQESRRSGSQRTPGKDSAGGRQQGERRQQPARHEQQPAPSRPHHHPHALSTDEFVIDDLPTLHDPTADSAEQEQQRKSRRRRRRRKGGNQPAEPPVQTTQQSSAAPDRRQRRQPQQEQQEQQEQRPADEAGGEAKRRMRPRRRHR